MKRALQSPPSSGSGAAGCQSSSMNVPAVSRGQSAASLTSSGIARQPSLGSQLVSAFGKEDEARRRYIASHRSLLKTAASCSQEMLLARRKAHAVALRAEYDLETGKDLKVEFADIEPATDDQIHSLAQHLSRALCVLFPQSRSQSSYFNLFRMIDKDGSGLISYYEFTKMIRELLKIPAGEMSETQLRRTWRWVDKDNSGTIGCGEYMRLMRRGWESFLEEQERLTKLARRTSPVDMMRRPNWKDASRRPVSLQADMQAWPEVCTRTPPMALGWPARVPLA